MYLPDFLGAVCPLHSIIANLDKSKPSLCAGKPPPNRRPVSRRRDRSDQPSYRTRAGRRKGKREISDGLLLLLRRRRPRRPRPRLPAARVPARPPLRAPRRPRLHRRRHHLDHRAADLVHLPVLPLRDAAAGGGGGARQGAAPCHDVVHLQDTLLIRSSPLHQESLAPLLVRACV